MFNEQCCFLMPNHNRSNICSPCRKHRVSNLEESVSLLKKVKTKT